MPYVEKEPTRTKYLRLTEPPGISYSVKCDACLEELDWDDDWVCPSCGTTWSDNAMDGAEGTLIAESGDYDEDELSEILEDETTDNGFAYQRGDEVRASWKWERS